MPGDGGMQRDDGGHDRRCAGERLLHSLGVPHRQRARRIFALGAVGRGELQWDGAGLEPGQGTYVYFGNGKPQSTPFGDILLDPGLPSWMTESANKTVPSMLEWFGKTTGAPLTKKPVVFLSWGGTRSRGRSSKGGGLDGVVQLAVWGEGWIKDDDDTRYGWLQFLGHEMFHKWNGDMFRTRDGDAEAWLSEGSSDFFARRVLLEIGAIDKERYRREIVKAANACLLVIGRSGIHPNQYGRPEYPCGSTLFAWADAIARDHGKTAGDVLGGAFAAAKARGDSRYTTDDVLDQIRTIAGDAKATDPFEAVLRKGITEKADQLFMTELARPGFSVSLVPAGQAELEDSWEPYHQVGVQLSRCDCDHRLDFSSDENGIRFGDTPQCPTIRKLHVVAVMGHALPKDAAAAYQSILERKPDQPIALRTEGSNTSVSLTCRKDAEMAPYKELLR